MSFFGEMQGEAVFDECYRYELKRCWDSSKGLVTFLMLNPSTATADLADRTIMKCIGFTKRWGYGGFIVGNLFAFIETNSVKLGTVKKPIGPDNDKHLARIIKQAEIVVCAWGNRGPYMGRDRKVLAMMRRLGVQPYCLKVTKIGTPFHPLYVGYDEVKEPRLYQYENKEIAA